MKALSIRADHLFDLVFHRTKKYEYRTWSSPYRGDLLLCSTAKKIPGTVPGHAICVCTLKDIKKIESKNLYAWQFTDYRDIDPFPIKGKLRLFDVDDELIHFYDYTGKTDEEIEKYVEEVWNPLIVKG